MLNNQFQFRRKFNYISEKPKSKYQKKETNKIGTVSIGFYNQLQIILLFSLTIPIVISNCLAKQKSIKIKLKKYCLWLLLWLLFGLLEQMNLIILSLKKNWYYHINLLFNHIVYLFIFKQIPEIMLVSDLPKGSIFGSYIDYSKNDPVFAQFDQEIPDF